MQAHWFKGPTPYKTSGSINSIVYSNLVHAQTVLNRTLTRQECVKLIKKMKDSALFETTQASDVVWSNFLQEMRKHKLVVETMPVESTSKEA